MAAVARAFKRALWPAINEDDTLQTFLMFGGLGLLVALVLMVWGWI